jgi:hypothetical protein
VADEESQPEKQGWPPACLKSSHGQWPCSLTLRQGRTTMWNSRAHPCQGKRFVQNPLSSGLLSSSSLGSTEAEIISGEPSREVDPKREQASALAVPVPCCFPFAG